MTKNQSASTAKDHELENQQNDEAGPEKGTNKGKEKTESTFTDRLQGSAGMFVSSLGSSKDGMALGMNDSKGTRSFVEERNLMGRTMGETSTTSMHRQGGVKDQSVRTPTDAQAAERSFANFQQGPVLPTNEHSLPPLSQSTVGEQEAKDGDAVLQILDEPSYDSGILENFRPDDSDDFLSPEERARLQKALFGEPRRGTPWATLLDPAQDLIPQLDEEETTEMLFGETELDSARQQWLDQWRDVLTSYTDEVWGDLGPLASEAQAEVSHMLENPNSESKKTDQALHRLRLVLAHLRG
ncbi:hypothetical protein NLU13_9015 [Sarocladium strictum]|uniref:Uncharacterized protein n=1 Tax=Sarocladium strictum TaxID=5046 RepID=A0AA39L3T2_SARSR|nr:hypothetical protein NLU13_9015 [Sarocladium strictum]